MHPEHFRTLLTSNGPYASVYFDDSHNTADAAAQMDLKWRALREQLEEQGADPAVTESIEQAITDAALPVGPSGRAVVASSDGVLVNEHLIRPIEPVVRVSALPYIVPVVEHGLDRPTYAVVIVDYEGGDITLYREGTAVSDTVDGDAYPVHKASGADTPGYGDPQRASDEARQQNIRAVASQLTTLVDDAKPEVVFVVGEIQSRTDLIAELPERVASLVVDVGVGARHSGFDDADLQHAIDQEFQRRRVAAIDDAAQRFTAELGRGEGMATEGLDGVTAALRAGAVETLIIGDVGDATIVAGDDLTAIAPNANVLSELGAAPSQTLRADEALPMAAINTGAALIRTDERIDPADGVAAILRYALPR
ncbi:Rv2629 family ribosome hibernation factor [Mycolicibacterium sp. XJ1904]